MIPRLFAPQSPAEASFATPLAALSDALSCIVTEERNGVFTLEMEYPIGGNAWDKIELGGFVVSRTSTDPSYDPQPFQIKKINRAIGGRVRIQAEHLTYALNGIVIKPPIASAAPMTTINWLNRQAIGMGNFTLGTDIPATTPPSNPTQSDYYTQFTSKSVMDCIVGDDASFVSYFGGEIYRDGNELLVLKERGKDNGVSIWYGKNLVSLSQTIATNDYYTEIFPYCKAAESTSEWIPAFITLTEEVLPIPSVSYSCVSKALPVDLSDTVPENPPDIGLETGAEE